MIRGFCICLTLWSLGEPAFAIDFNSGNYMLPMCQALADGKGAWEAKAWEQGECSGVIEALMSVGHYLPEHIRFCRPEADVTQGQARRIVVNFLHLHPEKLHESFVSLALDALREAWPCSKR